MRPSFPIVPVAALVLAALVNPLPARAAWSTDPNVNLPVCATTGQQLSPLAVSDGAGGAFVAWVDVRSGTGIFYATHILATGTLDPAWAANGVAIAPGTGSQTTGVMAADGAGGFYVAWCDFRNPTEDIYMQHMAANGTRVSGWPATGLLVGATTNNTGATADFAPSIASDGAGGAYVVWNSTYAAGSDYDVYGNHVNSNGTIAAGWPFAIDANLGIQYSPTCISDPNGNLLLAYEDNQNTAYYSIRVRAFTPAGASTLYTLLATGPNTNYRYPTIASDGQGGAFVTMDVIGLSTQGLLGSFAASTLRITPGVFTPALTAQQFFHLMPDANGGAYILWMGSTTAFLVRVSPGVVVYPGFGTNGIAVSGFEPGMIPDGEGGVIVGADALPGQVAAVRYTSAGALGTGWTTPTPLTNWASGSESIVPDGHGGAIAVWSDFRNNYTNGQDIYAQQIDHFGALGNAAPTIVAVKDVANDQGGHVRVSWTPSYKDVDPTYGIAWYTVFRQAPTTVAEAALRGGASALTPDAWAAAHAAKGAAPTSTAGRYLALPSGTQTTYWEQLATVDAGGLAGYSYVAATTGDSVAAGNPDTQFMVEAVGSSGGYWYSAPDSGYSVDNLPPVAPAPFTGVYVPGTGTVLTWGPNSEPDLAGYRLYKGNSATFTPGPGNLVAQLAGNTSYTDPSSTPGWYKLAAYDIHGNVSPFATLLPSGTAGVDGDLPHELAFALASPNPVRGPAALRLELPSPASVRVTLFDAAGRVVRELAGGERAAGTWTIAWDGADAAGNAAPSGLYFARLQLPGREITRRLVVAR